MMHKWNLSWAGLLLLLIVLLAWSHVRGVKGIQVLKAQQLRLLRNMVQLEQKIADVEQRLIRVRAAAGHVPGRTTAVGIRRLAHVPAGPAQGSTGSDWPDRHRRGCEATNRTPEETSD